MVDEQDAGALAPQPPDADADAVHAHDDSVHEHDDALADEMERESFPGSDPPSTWAGHDRPTQDGS